MSERSGNSVSGCVGNTFNAYLLFNTGSQRRCTERLEELGRVSMDSRNYNEAAEYFSTILSLDPVDRVEILVKRSKAREMMSLWGEVLSDADEV